MASNALVIVDDSSSDIRYSGDWQVSNLVQWYGGTSRSPMVGTGGSPQQPGFFTMNFEGESIAFYGITPARSSSQTFSVSIDGGAPFNASYGDPNPPSYRQWFQSPELPHGRHNITMDKLDGTMFDFAVVAASPDTSLQGKWLIVDDDSSEIQYYGGWRRSTNGFHSGALTNGLPFHNATHQTWNMGDSLSFTFTGTSLAVYGIFSWANLGLLSVIYSLDGKPFYQSYSVTTSSPEYVNKMGDASNFLFYSVDTISAGEHTLLINITQSTNQSFILDYISYSPSFATVGQMPNSTTTSAKSSTTTGSSGKGAGIPNPITTTTSNQNSPHKAPLMAIIGGIAGGLLFIASMAALIWFLGRRRSRKKEKSSRRERNGSADSSRPLMQDTLVSTRRTRPFSGVSHRSVSPYLLYTSEAPPLPNSGPALKQYRQDEIQRARRESRRRPVVTLIRMESPPPSTQGHEPRSSTERPSGSFESFYTYGGQRGNPVEQRRVEFSDSPSSGILSPYQSAGISTQSALPSATVIRRADAGSPRTRDSILTARDSVRTQGAVYPSRGLEPRSRSEGDSVNRRYTNSVQQVSSSPPRLTPMRRGFSDSPTASNVYTPTRSSRLASVPDLRQIPEIELERPRRLAAPLRSLPEGGSPPRRIREQRGPPQEMELRARPQTVQPQSQRLAPLRRVQAEPPASAPVVAARNPSIGSVFSRLSSILGRQSARDVPEDVNESDGYSDSEVPPAYESLSPRDGAFNYPRRGAPQASQQTGARGGVRPLPLPVPPVP